MDLRKLISSFDDLSAVTGAKAPDLEKFERILNLYVFGPAKKKGFFGISIKKDADDNQKVDALEFLSELQRICLDAIEMKSVYGQ